jgi:hypothetical protein
MSAGGAIRSVRSGGGGSCPPSSRRGLEPKTVVKVILQLYPQIPAASGERIEQRPMGRDAERYQACRERHPPARAVYAAHQARTRRADLLLTVTVVATAPGRAPPVHDPLSFRLPALPVPSRPVPSRPVPSRPEED